MSSLREEIKNILHLEYEDEKEIDEILKLIVNYINQTFVDNKPMAKYQAEAEEYYEDQGYRKFRENLINGLKKNET